MIKIYPTTASGLSHSLYELIIRPRNEPPSLKQERSQAVNITLSGETVISAWQKKVSGTSFRVEAILTNSEYSTLRLIDEHTSVFSWLIMTQGRSFTSTIDVVSAIPIKRNGLDSWRVVINFTIISELHR